MKPRIFIGSSIEALDIAYAVQDNLNTDAEVTVWTQGIFQLSSNSLDDLILALDNFDFGIFIFKPDDIAHMRNDKFNVVRDNVIFELGLFFGKLGRDRVFFVLPNNIEKFHLPTDLLGVMPGTYNIREDENLHAALGPFCNQIRVRIKNFVYESFIDLVTESKEAKKIAVEKKPYWEMMLSAALLRSRMNEIQRRFAEIQKGHVFKKSTQFTIKEFVKWHQLASADLLKILHIVRDIYLNELEKSWGPPGTSGEIYEIKTVIDKITSSCTDLLRWEIDLQAVLPPPALEQVPSLMKGWSSLIINEFDRLPGLLEKAYSEENLATATSIEIGLVFEPPPNAEKVGNIITKVLKKVMNGELDYE